MKHNYNCERSELSDVFNSTDFLYTCIYNICFRLYGLVVNVQNVSTCTVSKI